MSQHKIYDNTLTIVTVGVDIETQSVYLTVTEKEESTDKEETIVDKKYIPPYPTHNISSINYPNLWNDVRSYASISKQVLKSIETILRKELSGELSQDQSIDWTKGVPF